MPTALAMPEFSAEVLALKRELQAVQGRLDQVKRQDKALRARRRDIEKILLEVHEIDRAEVGRWVGVTSMAIEFDVYGRKGRSPRAAAG